MIMKTKRKSTFIQKTLFMLLLFFVSSAFLTYQPVVAKEKQVCPKIDKAKIRKNAKKLKAQRSNKTYSTSSHSHEHAVKIPNYM